MNALHPLTAGSIVDQRRAARESAACRVREARSIGRRFHRLHREGNHA